MVAATLVLLCTRPLDVGIFAQLPWLLPIPAIAIIGREVMHTYLISNPCFTYNLFALLYINANHVRLLLHVSPLVG
jgi:hypothetical protein